MFPHALRRELLFLEAADVEAVETVSPEEVEVLDELTTVRPKMGGDSWTAAAAAAAAAAAEEDSGGGCGGGRNVLSPPS